MSQSGVVIMFDGPDGVGKTTQLELAAKELRRGGRDVFTTRVLGGTPIGEELRKALFTEHPRPEEVNAYVALAMYFALAEEINNRRQTDVVLVDRSPLSIIAYEVFGGGLDKALGYELADQATQLIKPELLISYEASLDITMARMVKNHEKKDYFERQPKEYFERVQRGYDEAAKHYDATIIDASGTVNEVHTLTMLKINALLNK